MVQEPQSITHKRSAENMQFVSERVGVQINDTFADNAARVATLEVCVLSISPKHC